LGKNNVADLLSVDSLFTTQAERDEAQREKVVEIPLSEITDFPDHPFKVRMDEGMMEMVDSVKQYGVLVPALVRPKPDGGYEMVAGHRRKLACELAGTDTIPCIVRELTDDESTIIMVDSNLQREQLLPSEKAFAYKMKLDSMKHQGRRTDLTSSPLDNKLKGVTAAKQISKDSGDSQPQIYRFIRLTHLIPEILELVDNSVLKEKGMLQMAMRPAVELSYLEEGEQYSLLETMDTVSRHKVKSFLMMHNLRMLRWLYACNHIIHRCAKRHRQIMRSSQTQHLCKIALRVYVQKQYLFPTHSQPRTNVVHWYSYQHRLSDWQRQSLLFSP